MKNHITLTAALFALSGVALHASAMTVAPGPGEPTPQTTESQKKAPQQQAPSKRVKILTVPGPGQTKQPAR